MVNLWPRKSTVPAGTRGRSASQPHQFYTRALDGQAHPVAAMLVPSRLHTGMQGTSMPCASTCTVYGIPTRRPSMQLWSVKNAAARHRHPHQAHQHTHYLQQVNRKCTAHQTCRYACAFTRLLLGSSYTRTLAMPGARRLTPLYRMCSSNQLLPHVCFCIPAVLRSTTAT